MPCTDAHCTHPQCRGTPAPDRIAAMIREHGQFIMAVLNDDKNPAFAYTIGRTERGQPELLIFAADVEQLMEQGKLLNYLGPRDVKDGHRVRDADDAVYVAADLTHFPALQTAAHEEFVVQADHYYGRPVDVLFLLLKT